jgi:hypothetical protein
MGTAGSRSGPTKNLGESEKNHKCNQSCIGGKKSWQINLHPHPMLMFLFSPQRISFWREPQPDSSVNPSCHAKTTSPSSPNQESKNSTNECAESPLFLSPFPQLGFFCFLHKLCDCLLLLLLLLWSLMILLLSSASSVGWVLWNSVDSGYLFEMMLLKQAFRRILEYFCSERIAVQLRGIWVGLLNFEGLRIQLAHWYKKQRERRATAAATGKKR